MASYRAWLICGWVAWAVGTAAAEERIEFNRHVRPVLAENCFVCHGPDSASRKADLRLDRREQAVEAEAIVPGKPDESELIARVFASDADELMPPPASHKKLSPAQKEMLKRWIAAGAEYQPHWSLIAPQRPPLPAVRNAAWPRNPIDHFILARLEALGLAPAAEADRRTLARRVYLDLTGLPPTPEEVDAFVADPAADAYEKLMDRAMNSPHWGEHRARYWLDAARYADTHGLHFDNYREMWTYRDWVIAAFDRNLQFDRFTIEQLAGDLLPGATLEQRIASGFIRCNITTNEGGTIPEENLVLYTRDRTETASQIWLGLTANCAVCHDHKFDAISQKEFYALSAFFNNTTQGAMDGNIKDTPPIVMVAPAADRPRWDALPQEIVAAQQQIEARKQAARAEFEKWLAQPSADALGKLPAEGLKLHLPLGEATGKTIRAVLDGQPQAIEQKGELAWGPGHVAHQALKVDGDVLPEAPQAGDFDHQQKVSYGAWVKYAAGRHTGAIVARMDDQQGFRGWDLWMEGGRVGAHIIHHWDDDALKVVSAQPLKPDEWNHVMVSYDGSGKAAGVKVYVNGQPQKTQTAKDALKGTIRTEAPLSVGRRKTGSRLENAMIHDVRLYDRVLEPDEIRQLAQGARLAWLVAKPAEQRTEAERNELFPHWLATADKTYQELLARAAALEKEQAAIRSRSTIAHVAQEKPEPAKAFVLFRGEYDKRRDEVSPATFACLPPMPAELPRNRLGLAQWLMRPEHPLAARVTVNRFWQEVFGQGIVATAGDFGVSGEMPTHPELLDWLAVEFRESGWDVKKLFRLMLTSAAYRQAAVATAEKLERDPQNRNLSRGPRFRMDAEMVRDYALAASGLLVEKIGGPSVKPYQPPGVWEAVAMIGSNTRDYRQDSGESLYRRSLYTFWKRAAPPAAMDIFNAPSREVCTVRRERTNTPLQALAALNDPQLVEAARRLAERTLKEPAATPAARIERMAKRLLARGLRPDELKIAEDSLRDLLTFYATRPEEAKQLLAVGESKPDAALDPAQLAGWTMLANQLMNLDEVLNK